MSPPDPTFADAHARVRALRTLLQDSEHQPVRLVETHISWVLLTPTLAYKLKKPVRLPFLDFTTLDARRRFCLAELRLNQRLAPTLYLDVVEVRDGPRGPQFGGAGAVLDFAVRMRRFADGALWSEMLAAGTLAPAHVDAMASRLGDFHRDAAIAAPNSAFGSSATRKRVVQGLIESADARLAGPDSRCPDWPALRAWLVQQLAALAPLWDARQHDGRVRECHGDLHLANVLQWEGQATAFDCLEFDDNLRWIDVLDDLAFLAMDLLAHCRRDLAFRLVNVYLESSGDYDGLPTLRFFMACRALVRAQVAALSTGQDQAPVGAGEDRYLALALALSSDEPVRLAITHGLPGSGKSHVARALSDLAGALCVRSDVERKRLFGLGALQSSHERVPGGIYDAGTTARTYARLREIAQTALASGWSVVVDAAFLQRAERAPFAALAAGLAVPFCIVDCRAPLPLLQKRITHRAAAGGDPSEADLAVLARLSRIAETLDGHESAVTIAADAAQGFSPADLAQQWLAVTRR